MVAFSSAAFLSSITASGTPLTNSTTSGLRRCWPSATVNWLTASQSLLSGSPKSMTRACAPAIEPSARRYSTVTPSTSSLCMARLRSSREGASRRVSFRNASSSASAGRSGLRRCSARRRRPSRMTSR